MDKTTQEKIKREKITCSECSKFFYEEVYRGFRKINPSDPLCPKCSEKKKFNQKYIHKVGKCPLCNEICKDCIEAAKNKEI